MLPRKISDLLISLTRKTESGELSWNYNDEDSFVDIDLTNFDISIRYSFDMIEEIGQFRVDYFDKGTSKQHYFSTDQRYSDYEIVKKLFDSAQASGLNIQL